MTNKQYNLVVKPPGRDKGKRKIYVQLKSELVAQRHSPFNPRQKNWGMLVRRKSSSRWVLRRYDSAGRKVLRQTVIEGGLTTEQAIGMARTMFEMEGV
jgi:hypothetical protein